MAVATQRQTPQIMYEILMHIYENSPELIISGGPGDAWLVG
jgi:hypothetical protein